MSKTLAKLLRAINQRFNFEGAENWLRTQLYEKPWRITALILILFAGLLPLCINFKDVNWGNLSKAQKTELAHLWKQGNLQLNQNQPPKALVYLQKAVKLAPKQAKSQFLLASAYLLNNQNEKAQKPWQTLQKENLQNINSLYLELLQGIAYFKAGKYKAAEPLLAKATDTTFNQPWLVNLQGISLIANDKADQAFRLVGWPDECQLNSLAHAGCMKRLASWHQKINLSDQKQNLFHQKRGVIFFGESVKSLFKSIKEEVDGGFRLQLLAKYKQERQALNLQYAQYALQKYLYKHQITRNELSEPEKKLIL